MGLNDPVQNNILNILDDGSPKKFGTSQGFFGASAWTKGKDLTSSNLSLKKTSTEFVPKNKRASFNTSSSSFHPVGGYKPNSGGNSYNNYQRNTGGIPGGRHSTYVSSNPSKTFGGYG